MKKRIFYIIIFIILLPALVSGAEYHLNIDDRLSISVWGHDDLQAEVIVGPDGRINLPLVGSIRVEGMTLNELKEEVKARYAEYIKNPEINIDLKEYKRGRIMVLGEVRNPGSYQLQPGDRVLDAVSRAGGFNQSASLQEIKLSRGQEVIILDLQAINTGGSIIDNHRLQDGDVLFIAQTLIEVNIVGEVQRPGRYQFEQGAKLTDLLSEAGGLKTAASLSGEFSNAGQQQLINLDELLAGRLDNPLLNDGDMLFIPEDRSEVTISGAVQKPGSYPWEDGLTLSTLLARAGNRTAAGNLEEIRLVRRDDSEEIINLAVYLNEGKSGNNPLLRPGDSIFIPEKNYQVAVLGEVNRPGAYEWNPELKLSGLLARAGNPTERGDTGRINLTRQDGLEEEINLLEDDPLLQPGDTVELKETDSFDWQKLFNFVSGLNLIKDFLDIEW